MIKLDLTNAQWRKSSRSGAASGGGDNKCVEVAIVSEGVGVRDSKSPTAGHLSFTHDEWAAFIEGAKLGEFDL